MHKNYFRSSSKNWVRVGLTVLLLFEANSSAIAAYRIVLKDGRIIEAKSKPAFTKGSYVFTGLDNKTYGLPIGQVDLALTEASNQANQTDTYPQSVPAPPLETPTTATTLTNKDVLDMLKMGLAPEIIMAKMRSSVCNFDTSPTALQELKTAGVTDTVILAMVQSPVGPPISNAPANLPTPQTTEVTVPDGTPLEIELRATVSSEDLKEGDVIDFIVVQPLKVKGVTIVEKGAPAKARVAEVKKARHWGRAGQLSWAMQDVVTTDGNRIPLRFTKETEGGGSSGKVAAGVVATSLVFFPAAPVWGLKKGKPAVIPAGKRFDVFVHGDATVKVKAN